jgi:hypothetical protein
MTVQERRIATTAELLAAAADAGVRIIRVTANLNGLPSFRLSPGQSLTVAGAPATLRFGEGQDGLQLSADNRVEGIELMTDANRRAIFNDTEVEQPGRLVLRNLRTTGVVQLLARDAVRGGHVEVENIDIVTADARGYEDRPKGYGVEVLPGAFTLWNQQTDAAVTVTADLVGLSAGRAGAPVGGSGIFVSGGGNADGRLVARLGRLRGQCAQPRPRYDLRSQRYGARQLGHRRQLDCRR